LTLPDNRRLDLVSVLQMLALLLVVLWAVPWEIRWAAVLLAAVLLWSNYWRAQGLHHNLTYNLG
jgi:hypothetical protein